MSNGFLDYSLKNEKIKFDSVKHLHKRSIKDFSNSYSQNESPENTRYSKGRMKSTKYFMDHNSEELSTKYFNHKANKKETNQSFYPKDKIKIFTSNANLGVRNINSTKGMFRISNRKIDMLNQSILNNEHDLTVNPNNNDLEGKYSHSIRLYASNNNLSSSKNALVNNDYYQEPELLDTRNSYIQKIKTRSKLPRERIPSKFFKQKVSNSPLKSMTSLLSADRKIAFCRLGNNKCSCIHHSTCQAFEKKF